MFLFLYVENVGCCALVVLGFLIGHSVPSTIHVTLVQGNFDLKSEGVKYQSKLLEGHMLISCHCFDMNIIHVQSIFLTLDSDTEKPPRQQIAPKFL